MSSEPLVCQDLHKRFAQAHVLQGVDLRVEPGECVVLRGPNGAGKSTLIGCVTGTVVADRGSVSIAGVDLRRDPVAARRLFRVLPQEVEIPNGLTGHDWLSFCADVFAARGDLERAVERSGLGIHLERLASTYSVGMRKRLALATLALGDAKLLVLDEPFAGLDAQGRAQLGEWLAQRLAHGVGLLVAAHDQDDADLRRFQTRSVMVGPAS